MNPSSPSHSLFPVDKESSSTKGTNPLYNALRERRASHRIQPKNTNLYEVQKTDTVSSIAAHFNTTPSELVILNKLGSRTIFPSQIIYVPDISATPILPQQNAADSSYNGQQQSPKPGHVKRVEASDEEEVESDRKSPVKSPSAVAEANNRESLSKFLKIEAKHITDGEGVISGVLLVTPNHLMFDPNVSDPLVIEHGVEKYGVVAPIHMVVRAGLYTDIVRMRIKGSEQLRSENDSLKLFHSKKVLMKKSQSHNDGFCALDTEKVPVHFPGLTLKKLSKIVEVPSDVSVDKQDVEGEHSKEASQEESVEEEVEGTKPHQTISAPHLIGQSSDEEHDTPQLTNNEQLEKKKGAFEKTKDRLHKGLLKLPESLFQGTSVPGHRRMSLPISTSFQDLKSKVMSTHTKKVKTKEEKVKIETPSTSYKNMVDDMPDIFASVDKLIPRPAKSFDDNPLYLCLRMGQPINDSASSRISPIMNYGRKLRSEYWLSIPRARVDNLYWFLLRWAPDKYGEVYDVDFDVLGYLPICDDAEDEEESHPPANPRQRSASWAFPWRRRKSQDISDKLSPLSWDMVNHEECESDISIAMAETSLPEMLSPSDILQEEHMIKLSESLPARAIGYAWSLIYSTAAHGFSLKTMYREMSHYQSPVLIVIINTTGAIFGAMLSAPLRMSDHFYGTGESYLFTFHPEFKTYGWSGENPYFIKGNTASFAVGASDGQFGLWVDDDLFHGCSKECDTFGNSPLSDSEDFIIKGLEAWGFV